MKCLNKNIKFIYLLVICFLFIKLFNVVGFIPMIDIITPIYWFIIFIIGILITRDNYNKFYNVKDKIEYVVIILLIYLMLYFSSGLLIGYQYNSYQNKTIYDVLKNLYIFIVPIIFQEYIRGVLCNYTKNNNYLKIFISVLYILINFNFYSFSDINTGESFFRVLCNLIALSVLEFTITYLTTVGSYKVGLTYKLMINLYIIFIPIVPNLNFFLVSIIEVIVPFVIYLIIDDIHIKEIKKTYKEFKSKRVLEYVPIVIIVLVFILNQFDIFKYKATAIMSNSMSPLYYAGDSVIIKKISNDEKKKLKKGDIISFYDDDGNIIIHRIEEVIDGDEKYFITKGDNNKYVDTDPVEIKNIIGKYVFKIKFLGYPKKVMYDMLKG